MRRWSENKLVRGFLHVLAGNALFTASQALQFLILARGLGPTEFGRLAAAGSLTALLMPFSGMGAANVMIMRASRDPSLLRTYLGNALMLMLASGTVLSLLAVAVAHFFLEAQVPLGLIVVLAISELLISKLIDISWHAFVAREQLHYTSQFLGVQSVSRLVFAGAFVLLGRSDTAADWAFWALASNALVATWVLHKTIRLIGMPRTCLQSARRELLTGASFAVGISAKSFYTDADKVLLARFAGPESVGQYAMAFRVIQIALTPARALSLTLQARLLRAGEAGLRGSLRLTLRVLGPMVIAALATALIFYLTAPLLPLVAGTSYAGSVSVLRTLCLLPLLVVIQSSLYDALATSNFQHLAALSQVAAAALVCLLCALLIPMFDWRGAAMASYAAQCSLILGMGLAIYQRRRSGADVSRDAHA